MKGSCLHEIFAERVREAPDRVAVTAPEGRLTYAELDARARDLAGRLAGAGVAPGDLVGLCAPRGLEQVTGVLGILLAGAAYVPLDPDYPASRLSSLLEDTRPTVVAASDRAAAALPADGPRRVPITAPGGAPGAPAPEARPPAVRDSDLAYVIHTSGSTGRPKGVLVEHRQVVRLFTSSRRWFSFGPDDVWALFHSMSFDFSVWELWGALLHGGRLVIVPSGLARTSDGLLRLLRDEGVTVLNQTPSAFRQLDAAVAGSGPGGDALPALRLLVFGGERLDPRTLDAWTARHGDDRPRLVNMYGITETCVHVTYRRLTRADVEDSGPSPIGEPLPDLRVHLLDADGAEVPDGTPGEIWVSGDGVTRGYLGRPELTAERFTALPGAPELRCYRTGDRAVREAATGELRYLGRLDDQIKVRGFRIEPGEIEACLREHPGVTDAVVLDYDAGGGDLRLAACVTPAPGSAGPGDLAGELSALAAARLPAHLRPARYRLVPSLPLTAQGKADRSALRALLVAGDSGDTGPGVAAGALPDGSGPLPEVAKIVAEILAHPAPPGPHADLFQAGATSLAFVRVLARVNEHFGVRLTGAELDGEATIARLADCVTGSRSAGGGADAAPPGGPASARAPHPAEPAATHPRGTA
ncbi:amino acid adenylation domain-containing protein [Streptomyces sp. C10-9-1]|uniref:amino acid adenylation domain-containing protein n=1 Tax=Streptomyces sp. C10-9-1 TaxID=1859285 RepID=UPI003F49F2F9